MERTFSSLSLVADGEKKLVVDDKIPTQKFRTFSWNLLFLQQNSIVSNFQASLSLISVFKKDGDNHQRHRGLVRILNDSMKSATPEAFSLSLCLYLCTWSFGWSSLREDDNSRWDQTHVRILILPTKYSTVNAEFDTLTPQPQLYLSLYIYLFLSLSQRVRQNFPVSLFPEGGPKVNGRIQGYGYSKSRSEDLPRLWFHKESTGTRI